MNKSRENILHFRKRKLLGQKRIQYTTRAEPIPESVLSNEIRDDRYRHNEVD